MNADEAVFFGVRPKALSRRDAVSLHTNLGELRSDGWIITAFANPDAPVCYILRVEEVRALASQDRNGGWRWLEAWDYARDEFREAWHRLEPS